MTINKTILKLHEETNLPLDYLKKEQELSKDSDTKVDCENFVHWNLVSFAYSKCNYFGISFIHMDKGCKNCRHYKKKKD